MSEGVALAVRRNAFRFALTGLVGIWLSGCADATRFADGGNPFSNPFATASNDAVAPTPRVSSSPLAAGKPYNNNYATAARPSPSAVAAAATPAPEATGAIRSRIEPVGGTAKGWTAVGGSPIVVGAGDDAAALSSRYGVPEAALLSANGLHSRSEIHSGMRVVIPVYNANGATTAAKAEAEPRDAKEKPRHVAKRDARDDSSDDDRKAEVSHKDRKAEAKAHEERDAKKLAKAEKPKKSEPEKLAKVEKPAKTEKVAKTDKPAKAAEAAKPAKVEVARRPEVDKTPTGNVATASSDDATKAAENGQFRWPARGRIIQGFKSGGNDGINIALPEGTSVRASEDGKVAYAGSALKGYGNLVLIRHTNGFVTAYANNGELDVKSGDSVKRGQVIAKSGQTGDVSTPQLHFELRRGQTPVDPTNYLAGL
ncbi:MAG: peptidoglycan DD-metalloendopeptidase family protein [Pseudomonadota bacterium]|nr:peptidoglycan DD-metalloendopeptidase family protein [Pseudomonadota bacterium]